MMSTVTRFGSLLTRAVSAVAVVGLLAASMPAVAVPPGPSRTLVDQAARQNSRSPDRYWLQADYERDRDAYEAKRDADYQEVRVLDIAGVKPGMTIGEVGAGNGFFTLKLARRIGPSGKLYANDIVENFLAETRDRARQQGLSNIETVLGTDTDPRLPVGTLDMVFMVRLLHDLDKPADVLEKIALSLKPGAKLIVVDNEEKVHDGKSSSLQTRQQFLDAISRTCLAVERIDKSLPNARAVVLILSPK
jgi:ubiquinone/menaquinone biosynthesis C-methylase UbiE